MVDLPAGLSACGGQAGHHLGLPAMHARLVQRQNGILVRYKPEFDSLIGLKASQAGKMGVEGSIPSSGSRVVFIIQFVTIATMAKKRGDLLVGMVCKNCKTRNYVTMRNKVNLEGKLTLKKFCKTCKKKTEHRETNKLK